MADDNVFTLSPLAPCSECVCGFSIDCHPTSNTAAVVVSCTQASTIAGRVITKTSVVLDLKALKAPSFPLFKVAADMDQKNYPEVANKIYILNAPWFVSGMWKIAQRFVDPVTREKVRLRECLASCVPTGS